MKRKKIIVEVSVRGGVAYADPPEGVIVRIRDYDTDGLSWDELKQDEEGHMCREWYVYSDGSEHETPDD